MTDLLFHSVDHTKRAFKVVQSFWQILRQQVAVCKLVTNINKHERIVVNYFVLDLTFCAFELIDCVLCLAQVHKTLGIARFCPDIVINSELSLLITLRGHSRSTAGWTQFFGPVVHFTNLVKHFWGPSIFLLEHMWLGSHQQNVESMVWNGV